MALLERRAAGVLDANIPGALGHPQMSSKWEYQKNSTILELEARNRALQERLKEVPEPSERHDKPPEKEKMDLEKLLSTLKAPPLGKESVISSARADTGVRVPDSHWEWNKNSALLELERRNQALKRQLDSAELAALEQKALAEQEQRFIQELLQREKQNEVTLSKASAVKQRLLERAKTAVDAQAMLNALGMWREFTRRSRKKKLLQKLLALWRKQRLSRLLEAFQQGLEVSEAKREKQCAAIKFRRETLEKRALFCWGHFVGQRRRKRQFLDQARTMQVILSGRSVFASWQERCWEQKHKRQLVQKASVWRKGSLVRRGWLAWRSKQRESVQKVLQAEETFCKHLLRRWRHETERSVDLKSRETRFLSWRRKRCLVEWNNRTRVQREQQDEIKKMQRKWQAVRSASLMRAWHELAEERRYLETRCTDMKKRRALRVKEWAWKLLLRQVVVKDFRARRVEQTKSVLLRTWAKWCCKRKRLQVLEARGMQHARRNTLQRAFLAWRLLAGEGVRLQLEDTTTRFSARISDLESGLSTAQKAQSDALTWLEEYQSERRSLLASAELANARTPAWSTGMLDAELRWRISDSSGGPSPRSGHSAVALFEDVEEVSVRPKDVVVFGGWSGTEWFDDCHLFNSEPQTWTQLYLEGPSGRSDHCACAIPGRRMLLFGGFDGSDELDDLHILSVSEDGSELAWSQPDLGMGARPGPLSYATCCLLPSGRHVAVFGGYRSGAGLMNELWVLDSDHWQWSQPEVAGDFPRARRGHVMQAVGDSVIVHGGFDGQAHLDDLYVLDLNTMVWRRVDPVGDVPAPRRGHVSTVIGRHMLFHGGFDGTEYLDDVYTLDVDGFIWLQRAPMIARTEYPAIVEDLSGLRRELREMDPNVTQRRETLKGSTTQRGATKIGLQATTGKGIKTNVEAGMVRTDGTQDIPGFDESFAISLKSGSIRKSQNAMPEAFVGSAPEMVTSTMRATKRAVVAEGRAFHQAVFDGHRVVLFGRVHSHSVLQGVLLLENAAVEDGRALASAHLAVVETNYALRNECMRLEEELAASKAQGLGFRKASERLASALKVEAEAKKNAIAAQRILGQKLKKARAEGADLKVELDSLKEQLQSKFAECHLVEQHLTSAQRALLASEADHQKALFQAASTLQEERIRTAAKITELEVMMSALESNARNKQREIEGLKEARDVGETRAAELKTEVRKLQGLVAAAEEEGNRKAQRISEENLTTTQALERRLQEQEAQLEVALNSAREEATAQAEARAQSALQTEQRRADRLVERVSALEKERAEERRFVESCRRERDAAEAVRREAEAMRAEALEYSRAMESRCREELARMEDKVRASGLNQWREKSNLRPETLKDDGLEQLHHPIEVLLDASI